MSRSYSFTATWNGRTSRAPTLVFTTSLDHYDNAVAAVLAPAGKNAVDVRIRPVKERRTTGYRSQNHCINSWVAVIAKETGENFDVVKHVCKRMAISRGYRIQVDASGEPIYGPISGDVLPISEVDATKEEATALIETIEQVAAELEIELPRYPVEDP